MITKKQAETYVNYINTWSLEELIEIASKCGLQFIQQHEIAEYEESLEFSADIIIDKINALATKWQCEPADITVLISSGSFDIQIIISGPLDTSLSNYRNAIIKYCKKIITQAKQQDTKNKILKLSKEEKAKIYLELKKELEPSTKN